MRRIVKPRRMEENFVGLFGSSITEGFYREINNEA